MKTLIPLRLIAIVGNCLFLGYGLNAELGNIVLLHGSLLPLNALRLVQALRLRKRLHDMAHADFDPRALIPFMADVEMSAGEYIFKRGDAARDIYYLMRGRVKVEELDVEIGPGELIGEIAMFAPDKNRTQSAVCETDCKLMRISESQTLQLYADNPEFGLYVTKMMVARLLENAKRAPV
ncbi:MAG: Crp/Fnr family transcriptional regulator [Rhodospirillales bacterium]